MLGLSYAPTYPLFMLPANPSAGMRTNQALSGSTGVAPNYESSEFIWVANDRRETVLTSEWL